MKISKVDIDKFYEFLQASQLEQWKRHRIKGDDFFATAAWRDLARWLWDQAGGAQGTTGRKIWPYVLTGHVAEVSYSRNEGLNTRKVLDLVSLTNVITSENGGDVANKPIQGVTSSHTKYGHARDEAKLEILTHGPDLRGAAIKAREEQAEILTRTGYAGPFTDALLFELIQFGEDNDIHSEWTAYCKRTASAEGLTTSSRRR